MSAVIASARSAGRVLLASLLTRQRSVINTPACNRKVYPMCQLLGMNCNVPTDIVFSFEGFHRRGGLTAEHADGWGIAFFEEDGWRVFLDPEPSATSQVARFVRNYP